MMLKAQSLTYQLNERHIIEDISLEFRQGILYGILGPNGAGKTTLLKNLAGIWKPTTGAVLWNGEELLHKQRGEISQTISLVSQYTPVHFDFSVEEIVWMGRYPKNSYSVVSQEAKQIVEWALHTVDAWHLRQRKIKQLSHGERQRVYIARALATESPAILLDEAIASLDIRHQLEIWQLLKDLLSKEKVILVSVHDLTAAERFCDRIVVLNHGKCIAEGFFRDVMNPEILLNVFGVVGTQTKAIKLSLNPLKA